MSTHTRNPLDSLEQWQDFVKARYQPDRDKEHFRNYADAPAGVRDFYYLNHTHQTLEFVTRKQAEYLPLRKCKMGIWEAMEELNKIVDDSDPDTDLTQIDHAIQTAEAARADGKPRWFIVTSLIHDLGKVLCLFGEPQWAVVGDTFPVGCSFSDAVVFHEFFEDNPDSTVGAYSTPSGIYSEGCGLESIHLSWGHDEYLYHVTKPYLPEPAQYMIRYHSFYPWHKEGAYQHLTNAKDREMLRWVREFNPYDLYSKGHQRPNPDELMPYYRELVAEFFPDQLQW